MRRISRAAIARKRDSASSRAAYPPAAGRPRARGRWPAAVARSFAAHAPSGDPLQLLDGRGVSRASAVSSPARHASNSRVTLPASWNEEPAVGSMPVSDRAFRLQEQEALYPMKRKLFGILVTVLTTSGPRGN